MRRLPLRSPPRMRGKAKNRCRSCPLTRITPACAGKSSHQHGAGRWRRDHPRVCGEKTQEPTPKAEYEGSPPRVRGKVSGNGRRFHRHGITPAYAGKSKMSMMDLSVYRDHPRVCGEKPLGHRCQCVLLGSPPRMRGKGIAIFRQLHHGRITPAYAGKSRLWRRPGTRCRDHPRVCGEKKQLHEIVRGARGSPPRMRGKV